MPYRQIHKTQPKSRRGSDSNTKAILEGLRMGIIKVDAENGKIFNSKGYELKQVPNFFGYPQVQCKIGISNVKMFVHKAVWVSVHGPVPPDFEIDHIDNNNRNPKISNLQLLHWRQNIMKITQKKTPLQEAF